MRGLEHIPWLYDAGMAVFEPLGMGRWRERLVAGARGRVLEVGVINYKAATIEKPAGSYRKTPKVHDADKAKLPDKHKESA